MCKCKQLLAVLFIIAAILAVMAAKVDLNRQSCYRLVNTFLNFPLITVENDYVSVNIQKNGVWEPGVTRCVLENVKPSDVVVEIGANIGYYTVIIANILKRGNGKLISYEANEEVYRLAKASLILNHLEPRFYRQINLE